MANLGLTLDTNQSTLQAGNLNCQWADYEAITPTQAKVNQSEQMAGLAGGGSGTSSSTGGLQEDGGKDVYRIYRSVDSGRSRSSSISTAYSSSSVDSSSSSSSTSLETAHFWDDACPSRVGANLDQFDLQTLNILNTPDMDTSAFYSHFRGEQWNFDGLQNVTQPDGMVIPGGAPARPFAFSTTMTAPLVHASQSTALLPHFQQHPAPHNSSEPVRVPSNCSEQATMQLHLLLDTDMDAHAIPAANPGTSHDSSVRDETGTVQAAMRECVTHPHYAHPTSIQQPTIYHPQPHYPSIQLQHRQIVDYTPHIAWQQGIAQGSSSYHGSTESGQVRSNPMSFCTSPPPPVSPPVFMSGRTTDMRPPSQYIPHTQTQHQPQQMSFQPALQQQQHVGAELAHLLAGASASNECTPPTHTGCSAPESSRTLSSSSESGLGVDVVRQIKACRSRRTLSVSSSASSTLSSDLEPSSGSASKQKRFICTFPECGKAFSRNFNLTTHFVSQSSLRILKGPVANHAPIHYVTMLEHSSRCQALPMHPLLEIFLEETRLRTSHSCCPLSARYPKSRGCFRHIRRCLASRQWQ